MNPAQLSVLPRETLQELLLAAVNELLLALEKKDPLAIRAKRKQLEIIYLAIVETRNKNSFYSTGDKIT